MNFEDTDVSKLKSQVTDETFKYCERIINRYADLDEDSKKIARSSFYSAILNDPHVQKGMDDAMNKHVERLLD